jgi:hypothetical protein
VSESATTGEVVERVVRRRDPGPASSDVAPRGPWWVVLGITAVAALAAVLTSSAAPTGWSVADTVWVAVLAVAVTLAAVTAHRWTLIWATFVLLVVGAPTAWSVAALAAAVLMVVGFVRPPSWWVWPAIGGLLALTALHLPELNVWGASAAVAGVALVPVLVSGWWRSGRARRWVGLVVALVVLALLVISVVVGLIGFAAGSDVRSGAASAQRGLGLLREGSPDAAAGAFDRAGTSFDGAAGTLDGPWLDAARVVPVVAQQVEAAQVATSAGQELSAAAADLARRTTETPNLVRDGRIDLDWIRSTAPVAASSVDSIEAAAASVDGVRSGWLVDPLASSLADLDAELASAGASGRTAADVLAAAPDLLGGSGSRRYLVLATNLAEARFLGGFAGAYVVVNVTDGELTVENSGKSTDLTPFLAPLALEPGDADYRSRYARFAAGRYFGNVSSAPDATEVADVAASVYTSLTGAALNGVVIIDPAGLAALLSLTGPVRVEGVPEPIRKDNVEAFLYTGQYQLFDERNGERSDALGDIAQAVVDAVSTRSLPAPKRISSALAPAVDAGHIQFVPLDPTERSLLDRTSVTGRQSARSGADVLSVRHSNMNANKVDAFLQQMIDYRATVSPATGQVDSEATITLRNDAPTEGLPNAVIGGESRPPGNNRMLMSIWSALTLESVTVGGQPVSAETQLDGPLRVSTFVVDVPPGATVQIVARWSGAVRAGSDYQLDVFRQPAVRPDVTSVRIEGAAGATVESSSPIPTASGVASGTLPDAWRTEVDVRFAGSG